MFTYTLKNRNPVKKSKTAHAEVLSLTLLGMLALPQSRVPQRV